MTFLVVAALFWSGLAVGSVPPGYSWDTLPVHWFSANATSQLTPTTAKNIASWHSLAIINGQTHAYYASPNGTGSEGKMVEAGRVLKAVSPQITVLGYINSVVGWTAYDFYTWMMEDPKTRIVHDIDGSPYIVRQDHLGNNLYVPNVANATVRDKWVQDVVSVATSLDGVFIDRGDWSIVSPAKVGAEQAEALAEGHWAMITQLRNAIPSKYYILNNHNTSDFPNGYDHEYEMFKGTYDQYLEMLEDTKQQRLSVCHNEGEFNRTLPVFLLGAGTGSYYAAPFQHGSGGPGDPSWTEPAWDGVRPEYTKALGPPTGPAKIVDGIATRTFASGTKVWLNFSAPATSTGCVYWSDGTVTGNPTFC